MTDYHVSFAGCAGLFVSSFCVSFSYLSLSFASPRGCFTVCWTGYGISGKVGEFHHLIHFISRHDDIDMARTLSLCLVLFFSGFFFGFFVLRSHNDNAGRGFGSCSLRMQHGISGLWRMKFVCLGRGAEPGLAGTLRRVVRNGHTHEVWVRPPVRTRLII